MLTIQVTDRSFKKDQRSLIFEIRRNFRNKNDDIFLMVTQYKGLNGSIVNLTFHSIKGGSHDG